MTTTNLIFRIAAVLTQTTTATKELFAHQPFTTLEKEKKTMKLSNQSLMSAKDVLMGFVAVVLFTITLVIFLMPAFASAATWYVSPAGDNDGDGSLETPWRTIQYAINHANVQGGDTIKVMDDGVAADDYTENITVDKSLIIERYDTDSTPPWIKAADSGVPVFTVTVSSVTIKGLYIYGSTSSGVYHGGIYLLNVTGCAIQDNHCGWDASHTNEVGVRLQGSSTNTISGNTCSYNEFNGIKLTDTSDGNTISGNTCTSNTSDGISLSGSSTNEVSGNTCSNNNAAALLSGIGLYDGSNNNPISGNTCQNNIRGIRIQSSNGNTISGNNDCSNNSQDGIYLLDCSGSTISDNTCTNNNTHATSYGYAGIYVLGNYNSNTISGNTCTGNREGIYVSGGYKNVVCGNTLGSNTADAIVIYNSEYNTVSDNTCNSSGGHGIWLNNQAARNDIAGNTCTNNTGYGVFVDNSSDYNSVSGNTCSGNAYGIGIASSSYNRFYLNTLSGNTTKNAVWWNGLQNTFNSPTKFAYHYGGASPKNYMGNYYSDYAGSDGDSDGIGDTAYTYSSWSDSYPLMAERSNYTLNVWYLHNATMYKNDLSKCGSTIAITGGGSVVWPADAAAQTNLTFPAEFEGEPTSWTYKITFTTVPPEGQNFTLQIGHALDDGSDFTAGGPSATLGGDDSKRVFAGATSAASFDVDSGRYVALRITSSGGDARYVLVGGSWGYCSASEGSPDYPLPVELSSFTATPGDGQVALRWVTESEIANLGFHIYRAIAEEGFYDRITADLIEGAGTASNRNTYTFSDPNVTNGITYWYKLEDVAFDGATAQHGPIAVTPQAKAQEIETQTPDRYDLSVNVPNPFNPQTIIAYQLPEASEVSLIIRNAAGQTVRTLVRERREAGSYQVVWDSVNDAGKQVAAGVYLYELKAGDFVKVRKMTLLR